MSRKKTLEEWQEESNKIHNNEFIIMEVPKNGIVKINVLHKKCGNILNITLNNHINRYCIYCSGKNKKTIEEYQELSDKIHNNEFTILDEPLNIKTNVRIQHKNCLSIINMTMNNHISHKNGCKKCSKNSLKSNEYWIEKCDEIWKEEFILLDYVDNVWKKIRVKHSICNNTLIKSMNNLINNKRGCNICTRKAYGEYYIKEYFDKKNIIYITQKTFDNLINPKTGRKLKIDFYLPEYDIAIEVDGVQHYKSVPHWGGDNAFESQIYRDNIKNEYFGDRLVRINNKKIKDIENIWQQLQKNKLKPK